MDRKKKPAPRKPVKARGSLPAPKVAPTRDTTPWFRKPKWMVPMALLALMVAAVSVKLVLDARDRGAQRERDVRLIGQFERRVIDLNLENRTIYEELGQAPGIFLAGGLSTEEFRALAEGWVDSFRQLNLGIRNLEVPDSLTDLLQAKAHYVQATTIYVDAAKVFLLAAGISDPDERESTTVLARNLFLHGAAVYGMGDRDLIKLKNDYDLNDPAVDVPAPQMPDEEIPLPPAALEEPTVGVEPAPQAETSPEMQPEPEETIPEAEPTDGASP